MLVCLFIYWYLLLSLTHWLIHLITLLWVTTRGQPFPFPQFAIVFPFL